MKFLCLAYYDEKKFDALPKDEVDALVRNCRAHDEALHRSGRLIAVASLGPTRATKSVRPKQGKASVTDGPFAETKEQIGAFFIIEARDLNEAMEIASLHPAARLGGNVGWGIEVRPIDHFEQP
jgi:hypothetical protein